MKEKRDIVKNIVTVILPFRSSKSELLMKTATEAIVQVKSLSLSLSPSLRVNAALKQQRANFDLRNS